MPNVLGAPVQILLQTRTKKDIQNEQPQGIELRSFLRNDAVVEKYPRAKARTGPDPTYNCHGLTFASRRTAIHDPSVVDFILKEDNYVQSGCPTRFQATSSCTAIKRQAK